MHALALFGNLSADSASNGFKLRWLTSLKGISTNPSIHPLDRARASLSEIHRPIVLDVSSSDFGPKADLVDSASRCPLVNCFLPCNLFTRTLQAISHPPG